MCDRMCYCDVLSRRRTADKVLAFADTAAAAAGGTDGKVKRAGGQNTAAPVCPVRLSRNKESLL